MKIDFKKIFVQEAINDNLIWCGNADRIISRFPAAEIMPVESHWGISELFEANPAD